ncbi:unnamed protein product [Zymoseptoria tritici ST99CH_1A5]|uniref:Dienelactone hydrolase domain-containing protein n=2 Tax=Zymoseptoria tritici TaxID=1047171 RepID=A0A2H1FZD6_ZYMTR|nr:unnamed protein product [Zymoseptoria tritici ST99CH_1E4]SMY21828.1 unnamed protein product [Zymoseptoria tritici ST99CH_1A5]
MLQLHEDPNFHYEAIRAIGTARYNGADISEWSNLAERVLSTIDESKLETYSPITLRDIYFRASHDFFIADFFLHGNPADPRMAEMFQNHGFEIPLIIYRAAEASKSVPRPTLIIGGGFDRNMEETLHDFGFAALEREYNVILYEGPGMPRLLHQQKKGFIHDWEKVVSPIMDYIETNKNGSLSFVDSSKIGLIGMSLGGYLAARAAAFEPRLAATKTVVEFFSRIPAWDLTGVAGNIQMPALIGLAEDDLFFKGQPEKVAEAIGFRATLVYFGPDQAAHLHVASGALRYQNQAIFEWFAGVLD